MNDLEVTDLIYAAGFLDGEGCFCADNDGRIGIVCENTYKPVIDWLQAKFGGYVSVINTSNPKWRTTYRWSINGKEAYHLCQYIVPFLKEKMEQCGLLIAYYQLSKFTKRGVKVPEIVADERKRLALLVKGAKGRK